MATWTAAINNMIRERQLADRVGSPLTLDATVEDSVAIAAVNFRANIGALSCGYSKPIAPMWSSCAWVIIIPSSWSARSIIYEASAVIRSTPGVVSISGNDTPTSTSTNRSLFLGPYPYRYMFIPISPAPPRGR